VSVLADNDKIVTRAGFVDDKTAHEVVGQTSDEKKQQQQKTTNELGKAKENLEKASGGETAMPTDANLVAVGGVGKMFRVSDDILAGAAWQKYDNVQHLEGQQQRYRPEPKQLRTINFKQDYVVLIRKKLYYAANSASNGDGTVDKSVDKGHYLRTYKVDNFISLNTSISVMGQSPGTCSLSIKGGERVMCYEHGTASPEGTPTVEQLVSGEWPDNTAQIINDSTNAFGGNPKLEVPTIGGCFGGVPTNDASSRAAQQASGITYREVLPKEGELYNRNNAGTMENEKSVDVHVSGTGHVQDNDGKEYEIGKEATATFRNADGSEFVSVQIDAPENYEMDISNINTQQSKWKFAEKCDWEEMDEVWVFGKSNFERGGNKQDFKMNQIFFGYIDSVQKSYTAGKTNGCMITVQASDQLKILGLSFVTQTPSIAMGASLNGQGIDIRYGRQDMKSMGSFVLADHFAAMQATHNKSMGAEGTEKQANEAEGATYACFAYTNVFAGLTAKEIVVQMCEDAGVPLWYLDSRIEPIGWPPYVMKYRQATADMLFQMSTQKRLAVCQEVAKILQLEFFADERGNIVFKCPNYALGVNTLTDNNMGQPELAGGMLDRIETYQVNSSYWAMTERDLTTDEKVNSGTENEPGASNKPTTEKERAAYNKMVNARTQWRAAVIADTMTSKYRDAGVEQNEAAARINRMMDGWSEAQQFGLREAVYNRLLSSKNGHGKTMEWLTVDNGQTEYGNTLWDIAGHKDCWYDPEQWTRILADNADAFAQAGINVQRSSDGTITNASDVAANFYKFSGRIQINYNDLKSQSQLRDEFIGTLNEYNQVKSGNAGNRKTQQDYDGETRKLYENTLSELTDALIPEVPQEFIVGFTLTTTDRNVFNSYEVNIEADFGLYEGNNTPITKLTRVFADIPSFIRFGVRPCPQPYNFPYMGNRENAHLLGYMLCARSLAMRNSAQLTMIEDSFIRVGDPIRFFAYDEHPYKPLASQERVAASSMGMDDSASALNIMGRDGKTLSGANDEVNSASILAFANRGINANTVNPLEHSDAPSTKTVTSNTSMRTTYTTQSTEETTSVEKENEPEGNETIKQGDRLNIERGGGIKSSNYSGIGASFAAMQTQAQTIYYVEAVNRQISPSQVSQMTLSLSCGRMMGQPSVVDYMLLLYKNYYDANTGFSPDMNDIMELRKRYQGNTKTYTPLTVDDTIKSIAEKEYGVDFSPDEDEPQEGEQEKTDQDLYGDYALTVCTAGNTQAHELAKGKGWKFYSAKTTGAVYIGESPRARKIATFTYYEYDGSGGAKAVFHLESGDDDVRKSSNVDGSGLCVCEAGEQQHAYVMVTQLESLKKGKKITVTADAEQMPISKKAQEVAVELNTEQKKIIHFMRVLCALNAPIFGSTLSLTGEQIDNYIHDAAASGKHTSLTIPNELQYQLDPLFLDATQVTSDDKKTDDQTDEQEGEGGEGYESGGDNEGGGNEQSVVEHGVADKANGKQTPEPPQQKATSVRTSEVIQSEIDSIKNSDKYAMCRDAAAGNPDAIERYKDFHEEKTGTQLSTPQAKRFAGMSYQNQEDRIRALENEKAKNTKAQQAAEKAAGK